MRSGTWRGVSKWSRHKDRYIGRLCLDTGMVPDEFGDFPKYQGVSEPPGESMGLIGPWWERGGGGQVEGAPPQAQSELGGGRPLIRPFCIMLL